MNSCGQCGADIKEELNEFNTRKCADCGVLLCDDCAMDGMINLCEECEENWWEDEYGDFEYGME